MSWEALLSEAAAEERTLPWTGGRRLFDRRRAFKLAGATPPEHGWHRFRVDGSRRVTWAGADTAGADPAGADTAALELAPIDFDRGRPLVRGYLVGDRLVPDTAAVGRQLEAAFRQGEKTWLVEPGLGRFARVLAARTGDGRLIFAREEFPLGPEPDVLEAFEDERDSVADIPGVPPALELAFLWLSWRRAEAEERRRELELMRQLEAEEAVAEAARERIAEAHAALIGAWRRDAAVPRGGGAKARRDLARVDFEAAARSALSISGAKLLDATRSRNADEWDVRFRFQKRRFAALVEERTLRIIDSGVCLIDHRNNIRGDTRFTLESLPAVLDEAIRTGRLVIFRAG